MHPSLINPAVVGYVCAMGLALAYYSTTIATAGVGGVIFGTDRSGDVLSVGTAFVMVGVAMAAVFGFLALTQIRALGRRA